jgi:hypothetical protein
VSKIKTIVLINLKETVRESILNGLSSRVLRRSFLTSSIISTVSFNFCIRVTQCPCVLTALTIFLKSVFSIET